MVGGNGDRLLALAARRAGIVQLVGFTPRPGGNDYRTFSDDGLAGRVAHVRDAAGDRFPGVSREDRATTVRVEGDDPRERRSDRSPSTVG